MNQDSSPSSPSPHRSSNLFIVGCFILFTVILGTTSLGYIPVPTAARNATTMHLPTIIASLLEGWPVGVVVGTVFGITSLYMGASPMSQDPIIAMVPRMLTGLTPYMVYSLMRSNNEYVRLGIAAVVGTLTNTCLYLGLAVLKGMLTLDTAINIAFVHGLPEVVVAVIIVIPAVLVLRKGQAYLDNKFHN